MKLYEFLRQYPDIDSKEGYIYRYIVNSASGRFIRRGRWNDDNILDARYIFRDRDVLSFSVDLKSSEITINVGGCAE